MDSFRIHCGTGMADEVKMDSHPRSGRGGK